MIQAGLIGGALSHSLSPQIHSQYWQITGRIGDYALLETAQAQLSARLEDIESAGYAGVNVTIPHKKAVMTFLDELSPEARAIGAVNTVQFTEGRRIGHNTDYFGLQSLLSRNGFELKGRRVAILGAGGAARCAMYLARDMDAADVLVVSRRPETADADLCAVGYDALEAASHIDVLINATPVGMHPDVDACPVPESVIGKCGCVADMIYNPAETVLLQKAAALGIPCANGLWMLVAQALKAQEIWTGEPFCANVCERIYNNLKGPSLRSNIVLIGMPGSGKTTVMAQLAQRLDMRAADTDHMIEQAHGPIPQIFSSQGESGFRDIELCAARRAATLKNTVIATGGGIVHTSAAMDALRDTGVVMYIDRPLQLLLNEVDTSGRPLLAAGRERLISLYDKRHGLYTKYADVTVPNDTSDYEDCMKIIIEKLEEMQR